MPKLIDEFLESQLGLITLEIPEEDKAPEDTDLESTVGVRLSFNTRKYGRGHIDFALDTINKKIVYAAVSPDMIRKGLKKSALKEAHHSPGIFNKCWDKPTTSGVAGCVVETFIDWM